MPQSRPVYIPTFVASVVARLRSELGRREWRNLLECHDYDHQGAWREYVTRACPTCPETYISDVIDDARKALSLDRPRIRRARRVA